ncbi:MAG: UvrD-helicase domain-containing protein [Candidatus Brocadiia bacterium]
MSADEDPRIRDQDIRERIIHGTGRSMLVEAAAGTGKTTLMVDRILQGIREGSLRLPETVAITFTEKAAGELEERVRERLAAELNRPDTPPDQRNRLQRATEELDRAHISTIHAFCAQLLRERPAEAGVDPAFEVLDGTGAELLRRECWRDWIDEQAAGDAPTLVEALRADVSSEQLRALADELAAAPELLEMESFRLPRAEVDVDECVGQLARTVDEVHKACTEFMRGNGNSVSRSLRDVSARMAEEADAGQMRRLAYEAAGIDVETALKSFGNDRDEVRPTFEAFVEQARRVAEALAADVFDWMGGFVRYYTEVKAERSALDFQDLLLLTARMLRERPEVRRYFQRRFKAFFVDEFQDTDPLQAELIAYLCEVPDGAARRMSEVQLRDGALLAVGDPKQSIYRFRRADVQVYEEFKKLFGPDGTEHIYCNFRSVSPLLGWFNGVFERVFQAPPEDGVYQAEHVPLEAGLEEQRTAGPAVVALCPDPDEEVDSWNAGPSRLHEAHYLARTVRMAVDGDLQLPGAPEDLSYGKFAFLFRALTNVDIYEEALEARGIPYRVLGGKHFYKRSQTVETLSLLRAVDDPLDHVSIVAALRSSYFGLSDEDLLRYRESGGLWNYLRPGTDEGPVAEAMRLLSEWHNSRNRVAPHVLLQRMFDQTRAPAAYRLKPAGEQRAATLQQLRRRVRSLSKAARTFGAVVRYLSSIEESQLSEEESSSVEPGDEFVQLLSMHKAKGLEFPVVALPDLSRRFGGGGGKPALLFDRQTGEVAVRVTGGVRTRNYGDLLAIEQGSELAELRRLFYVACTRAENTLVLPLHWYVKSQVGFQEVLNETGLLADPGEVPYGRAQGGVHYIDSRGWSEQIDVTARRRGIPEQVPEEAEPLLERRAQWQARHEQRAGRASRGLRFVRPSYLDHHGAPGPAEVPTGEGPAGREFGTLFHNLMRLIPLDGGAPDEAAVRGLASIEAAELGLDDEAAREAARLAGQALETPELRDLLASAESVAREVPFTVPIDELPVSSPEDAFVEGSIDLLVRTGARTVVLDYKTDQTPEPARYWPQVALYALAAQAAGQAGRDVELVLFFVRHGELHHRPLDDEARTQVDELIYGSLQRERC